MIKDIRMSSTKFKARDGEGHSASTEQGSTLFLKLGEDVQKFVLL